MEFKRAEGGEAFYLNFADGSEAAVCPEGAEIISVLEEDLPQYGPEDLGAVSLHSDELDVADLKMLTFKSWWFEDSEEPHFGNNCEVGGGLKKKYVTVNFNIANQTFELHMDNDQEISLYNLTSVTAKNGLPVQAWDLHIGAKLNLLGKSTTLLQGSMATIKWLEFHAKRLKGVKTRLEKELSKYNTISLPMSVTYSKGAKARGGASLRALLDQIDELKQMLAKFRPSLAETLVAGILDITG